MSNEDRIVHALETFELPIYSDEVPEDEETMHYFYYRPVRLERSGTAHFLQIFEVAYVSMYQEDLMEEDIIDALEDEGMKFRTADYERARLAKTNASVDIVIFTVSRPLRRKRCM